MKKLLKLTARHLVKPLAGYYLRKERAYRSEGLRLRIPPGVFHPGFFFSTRLLVARLKQLDLSGKSLLELGAGSGMISLVAARAGAIVTASDISGTAVEAIRANAHQNNIELTVIESDLFSDIPPQHFDYLIINPPYYPRDPVSEDQHAWYCGSDFQYFRRLFRQIRPFVNQHSTILMILSEDCDIERIHSIAKKHNYKMVIDTQKRILWEMNYIFRIQTKINRGKIQ